MRPAFAFLFCLVSFYSHVSAQETPRRDPQALAVLGQSYAAMGAPGPLQVRDSVVVATVQLPGRESSTGTVTIKTKGPNMLRFDGVTASGTSTSIVNRGRPLRRTADGWRGGPSANSRHRRADHFPALLLAHELPRENLSVTYVGLEEVEHRKAHRIRVARVSKLNPEFDERLTKNSELDLFVDAETFLVLGISYIYLSDTDWRRGLPMEIYYRDYRRVAGVLVPFYQRKVFNGYPISEMSVTSVAFNVGLLDSEFEGR